MRIAIVGLIALALLTAGGTVFLVKRYLDTQSQVQAEAEAEEPVSKSLILVADRNLPAGTTIATGGLTGGDLRWQPWPEDAIEDSYVVANDEDTSLEQEFFGAVVRRGISGGEPITAAKVFKRDQPGFLAGALEPGMRAIAVSVTAASGAAGFILPGDYVDVILTHDIRRDAPRNQTENAVIGGNVVRYTSETILADVRVLAIDQEFNDIEGEATVVKTVTLEVTPEQAEAVAVANMMGQISLALRSLAVDTLGDRKGAFTSDLHISPTLSRTFGEEAEEAEEEPEAAPEPKAVVVEKEVPEIVTAPPLPAPELSEVEEEPIEKKRIKVYRGGARTAQEFAED